MSVESALLVLGMISGAAFATVYVFVMARYVAAIQNERSTLNRNRTRLFAARAWWMRLAAVSFYMILIVWVIGPALVLGELRRNYYLGFPLGAVPFVPWMVRCSREGQWRKWLDGY